MKSLINTIEIGGVKDALNILAKAGDEDLFEKAKHQIGDSHPKWPQLKWTDLGGGKFGWRTGTGRGKRANTGNAGGTGGGASTSNSSNAGKQKDLSIHAKETDTKTLENVVNSDKAPKDLKDAAKKELQNRGEKTDTTKKTDKQDDNNFSVPSGAKLTPKQQKQFNEFVDKAFLISSEKYNDTSKMKIERTPRGNWRCYYNGKDTGVTIDGKLMSDALAKKIGINKEPTETKKNSTYSKNQVQSTNKTKKKEQPTNASQNTTPKISYNMQKLFDAYSMNSSKYNDPNRMSIETTPKGNWAIKYDGKRVATIRSLDIDKEEFDDLGITIE